MPVSIWEGVLACQFFNTGGENKEKESRNNVCLRKDLFVKANTFLLKLAIG